MNRMIRRIIVVQLQRCRACKPRRCGQRQRRQCGRECLGHGLSSRGFWSDMLKLVNQYGEKLHQIRTSVNQNLHIGTKFSKVRTNHHKLVDQYEFLRKVLTQDWPASEREEANDMDRNTS
jgi:hypothetical protein